MTIYTKFLLGFAALFFASHSSAQLSTKERDSLRANIIRVAASVNARVGVSISLTGSADTLNYRGDERFPMMSVYKFPIAIAVLKEMDRGNAWMEKYLQINKDSVFSNEKEKYTESNFPGGKITVGQLLTLMLVQSSNTAADMLLGMLKGPDKIQQYLDDLDIRDMAIANTEAEMNADSLKIADNWSTPMEMNRLLTIAYTDDYLGTKSHDFLWDKMTETVTGPDRLSGLLPKGTAVAHRTGTGYGCYNDVGIITLPKGGKLVISVFIAEAQDSPAKCSEAIAKIGKLAWDYYARH
jgi:beta-lactamase class A